MLPFLKKRDDIANPTITVKTRTPDKTEENQEDNSEGIKACAQDLIDAVHARDVKGVADAMKAAFDILESEPHEEGPHINPHSYEASKEE